MIKVVHPGFYSTIQDLGRYEGQNFGVPMSGVMDRRAAILANRLVGNTEHAAVLEVTMLGPKLQFDVDVALVITGGNLQPKLNGKSIQNNKYTRVPKGSVLSFGHFITGYRAYLSIKGGFKTAQVLGSYSMYQGVSPKNRIEKGAVLEVFKAMAQDQNAFARLRVDESYISSQVLEVYKGPEFDRLSVTEQALLLEKTYTISKYNNRMAYQVEEVLPNGLESIITSPVLPGTVQLTASGQLIILMRDCQTTGGYPRLLLLSETAIAILSQKPTGGQFVFKLI